VLAAQQLSIDEVTVRNTIANFQAAFDGRGVDSQRQRVDSVIENPVGMNETIRAVLQAGGQTTLLVLNDRTPDGTDVSWTGTQKLVEGRDNGVVVIASTIWLYVYATAKWSVTTDVAADCQQI